MIEDAIGAATTTTSDSNPPFRLHNHRDIKKIAREYPGPRDYSIARAVGRKNRTPIHSPANVFVILSPIHLVPDVFSQNAPG